MTPNEGARGIRSRHVAGALTLLLAACAQLEMPPGGPEDVFPPYVTETRPDTFAVVEPGLRSFS